MGCSAVVSCACELVQLFSVVFYVVRSVHKSDSRLVTNKTRNKWRAVAKGGHKTIQIHVFEMMHVFPPDRRREREGTTHALQVKSIPSRKNTLIVCESARGLGVMHRLHPTS